MKKTKIVSILFLLFIGHFKLLAQYKKVEQTISFQSRLDNPIKVEVQESNGRYRFVAFNRSFYQYQLELTFEDIRNMTPRIIKRKYDLIPGRTSLFTLSVVHPDQGVYFNYHLNYRIGIPSENVDLDFPYLIPLNKRFEPVYYNYDSTKYLDDCFKISRGDTVFCMRKGHVAAVPNMYHSGDRIANDATLEITHDDGTVMIYKNINPDSVFVKAGQTVFPMQPLGVINKEEKLKVRLLAIKENGKLKHLDINYCLGENITGDFSKVVENKRIVHPEKIIISEMKRREKRKYKKGTLYK